MPNLWRRVSHKHPCPVCGRPDCWLDVERPLPDWMTLPKADEPDKERAA